MPQSFLYLQLQFHNSRFSPQMFSQLQLESDNRGRNVFEIVVCHVLLEAERFRNVGRQKDVQAAFVSTLREII